MNQALRRGALIVFEGCDRAGKTTQCHKLVEVLKREGHRVELMKFPDRSTTIGQMISQYLQKKVELEDHVIHLLFAANRWEAVKKMENLLLNGTTLVVDRYSFSGIAFSAAKPHMDFEWLKQPEVGLLQPDLVLFLELSSDVASKRGEFGQERYEQPQFQRSVRQIFRKLQDKSWQVINADGTPEEVHQDIYEKVKRSIELVSFQQLKKFDKNLGNDQNCEDLSSDSEGVR
ncbi:thymidylate kinase-like [Limulus polyphemus]|uniref:dTMP kinase n=1 Tax=Limulus polyphemus TaxID=6850 RepID=A0ABM1BUA1_LIMPO|nr:thymidylate kinase-like [Limulus polyphemus]